MGAKQEVVALGAYPAWGLALMDEVYRLRRPWDAPDRDAFLLDCADARAVVTRGAILDEAELLDALESGRIAGAGLDVFLGEPRIDPRFAALESVVLQPHHGSGTVETRRAMGRLVHDNLAAHFANLSLPTPVI